jgi:hypothetical protein
MEREIVPIIAASAFAQEFTFYGNIYIKTTEGKTSTNTSGSKSTLFGHSIVSYDIFTILKSFLSFSVLNNPMSRYGFKSNIRLQT